MFGSSYIDHLPHTCYSRILPTPVSQPTVIAWNTELAQGLDLGNLSDSQDQIAGLFSGNIIDPSSHPIALAYAGHQFGHLVPQLGDGRAILLGDIQGKDIQLKGSGPTPYSRNGDGRAALGPMLREYLVSEAMHALGIPTTRSLAVIGTGELVQRETLLPGATLTRVADCHIRVGTFQYFAIRQDYETVQTLADYCINRLLPHIRSSKTPYQDWLDAIIDKQAYLVAQWMSVGFIHGVMNTDNVSISGETIDYGPCAFLDEYQSDKVFSSIDQYGRYRYAQQSAIMQWNLARLAECILPLLDTDETKAIEMATASIDSFSERFNGYWLAFMGKKLGIRHPNADDRVLIAEFLDILETHRLDFTVSFRTIETLALDHSDFEQWRNQWLNRVRELSDYREVMACSNPIYIPRNHLIEKAIREAYTGDFSFFHRMVSVLKHPYETQPDTDDLMCPPDENERVSQTFCGT